MINPINATELTASIQRDYQQAAYTAQVQDSNLQNKKGAPSIIQSFQLLLVGLFAR